MKRQPGLLFRSLMLLTASLLLCCSECDRPESVSEEFLPLDVYVDPMGTPLAAFQIEIEDTMMVSSIVGIEGGDHPAFGEPPHYDTAAIQHHRVILAAFSMEEDLPVSKTRIATIHLLIEGEEPPSFTIRQCITADPDGSPIVAGVTLVTGKES